MHGTAAACSLIFIAFHPVFRPVAQASYRVGQAVQVLSKSSNVARSASSEGFEVWRFRPGTLHHYFREFPFPNIPQYDIFR